MFAAKDEKVETKVIAQAVLLLVHEMDEWLRSAKKPGWINTESLFSIVTCIKHITSSNQIHTLLAKEVSDDLRATLVSLHFYLDEAYELLKLWAELSRLEIAMPLKMILHMQDLCNSLTECWSKHLQLSTAASYNSKTTISEQPNSNQIQVHVPPGPLPSDIFSSTLLPPTVIRPQGPIKDIPPYSTLVSFNGLSTNGWSIGDLENMFKISETEEKWLTFRIPVAPMHMSSVHEFFPQPKAQKELKESKEESIRGTEEDDDESKTIRSRVLPEFVEEQTEKEKESEKEKEKPKQFIDFLKETESEKNEEDSEGEGSEIGSVASVKPEPPPRKQQTQQQQAQTPQNPPQSEEKPVQKKQQFQTINLSKSGSNSNISEETSSNPSSPRQKLAKMLPPKMKQLSFQNQKKEKGYRFLLTVECFRGLPEHPNEDLIIEYSTSDTPIALVVKKGVAIWNTTLTLDRYYSSWLDKDAEMKFKLKWKGRKFAKINLNLEQLRRDIDDVNGVTAKSAHIATSGGNFISMDFTLDYAIIDHGHLYPRLQGQQLDDRPKVEYVTQVNADNSLETASVSSASSFSTSASKKKMYENQQNNHANAQDTLLQVKLLPGPLGASFSTEKIPPTIMRFVPLPDGSVGPLEDIIPPFSEIIAFNDIDTTTWTFDDFKRHMYLTGDIAQERVLTFRLPVGTSVDEIVKTYEQKRTVAEGSFQSSADYLKKGKTLENDNSKEEGESLQAKIALEEAKRAKNLRVVGEFVEHPVARDFWVTHFGASLSVDWNIFKDSISATEKEKMYPRESWEDRYTTLLAHHLDTWLKGKVHICSYNRLTRKGLGLIGAMEAVLEVHQKYSPRMIVNSEENPKSNYYLNDPSERTVLITGVDMSCIETIENSRLPSRYSPINLWLEKLGTPLRSIAAIHGIGVVVEFEGDIDVNFLGSRYGCPIEMTLPFTLRRRHFIEMVFPSPYRVDDVISFRSTQNPRYGRLIDNQLQLLRLAACLESAFADEELITAQLNLLQKWLQSSLTKNEKSDSENPKAGEMSIIHAYKKHITRITTEFDARQSKRAEEQSEILRSLSQKHRDNTYPLIKTFFSNIRQENVKKIDEVVSSATKSSWVVALRDTVQSFIEDTDTENTWVSSFVSLVKSGQNFGSLVKRVELQKTEAMREEIIEIELPGSYKATCAEADKLLELFTSTAAKCDTLVALYPIITDRMNWDKLLTKHVPSTVERESVQQVVGHSKK